MSQGSASFPESLQQLRDGSILKSFVPTALGVLAGLYIVGMGLSRIGYTFDAFPFGTDENGVATLVEISFVLALTCILGGAIAKWFPIPASVLLLASGFGIILVLAMAWINAIPALLAAAGGAIALGDGLQRIELSGNNARAAFWRNNLREFGLLICLLLIMLFFEYKTAGVFFRGVNVTNLMLQNSYVVVMALGMLLIIVGGNIDLSVGSIVGFVGAVSAYLMVYGKVPYPPIILFALMLGGVIGAAQGYFVAYSKIPAFIVTLAGMLIMRGLTGQMLQGQFVGPFAKGFQLISAGFIPDFKDFGFFVAAPGEDQFYYSSMFIGVVGVIFLVYTSARRWMRDSSQSMETEPLSLFVGKLVIFGGLILGFSYLLASNKGLPNVLIIMGALTALYTFATTRMTIGRRVYAMGGNRLAAQLSGVPTDRLTFLTFVNMGVLAGLAGLIVAARLNSATPSAGNGFELDVIAACFIGGVSASGGVGKVMGVVIGAFFMGVMNNGMSILGIGIFWQQVVKGIVLLAAVYVDVYQKSKG